MENQNTLSTCNDMSDDQIRKIAVALNLPANSNREKVASALGSWLKRPSRREERGPGQYYMPKIDLDILAIIYPHN